MKRFTVNKCKTLKKNPHHSKHKQGEFCKIFYKTGKILLASNIIKILDNYFLQGKDAFGR